MNILDFTLEELQAIASEKSIALDAAKADFDIANANVKERKRLENLKNQLGNVSADDIAKVIESITLSAKSISSEESVQLSS